MGVTNVTIKTYPKGVSSELDAGNDIQIVNGYGNFFATEIFLNVEGEIKFKQSEESEVITLKYAPGGWHRQTMTYIYADGTDSGIGLHVRNTQE